MKKIFCIFAAMFICIGTFPDRQCVAEKPNVTAKGARIRAKVKEQRQTREQKSKNNSSKHIAEREESVERTEHRRFSKNRNFRYTKTGGTDFKRY